MKCRETNKLFTAYLDNEVTARKRENMQAHLASCPDCRREMETLSVTKAKLRRAFKMVTDEANPSDAAWAQLREQVLNEKEKEMVRVLPARETWWERMGRVSLIPRRLTSRNATAGLLAVIVIASLAVTVTMFTRNGEKLSAAEIALANHEVQAALDGAIPTKVGTTKSGDNTGITRVVLDISPDRVVIAEVAMATQRVKTVHVQLISDVLPDNVIALAKADPRVRNLIESGYILGFLDGNTITVTSTTFDERETEFLKSLGINNLPDFIGFTALITLESADGLFQYLVWVNASTEKVVALVVNPFYPVWGTVTTTTISPKYSVVNA